MERGNKDKILRIIDELEKSETELEKYISELSILTRNEMLQEIMNAIIEKNTVLQEIERSQTPHSHSMMEEKTKNIQELVVNYVLNIQENPTKKIIYLREFLDNLKSISNQDKEVILNSLQDEKDFERLKEKMTSLVTIFL
ncbi:MAG: hypothetical protein ACFFD7_00030 [Candidatus Thorarchaeota archaeon]